MQASQAVRRRGPLPLPARAILLVSGLAALALALFNLFHELHAAQVGGLFAIVALVVGVLWLASIIFGFLGWRLGVFVAGTIAFIELGYIGSTHFVQGTGALGAYAKTEGLPVATDLMGLVLACTLTMMAAIVCWSHASGHSRRRETLPILIVSAIGALLTILEATDNVHLASLALPAFGSTSAEDGTFTAALLATLWLIGGLWVGRVRRTGALLIAVATFEVGSSFVTLHLVKGGTTLSQIGAKSGLIWALIAAALAILAAASFLLALGLLAMSVFRQRRAAVPTGTQPARREA